MTTDTQGQQYLYDAEGRICAASGLGGMMGYIYDAEGNRVAKGAITSWSCNTASNGFTATESYVLGPGGEQLTELAWSGGAQQWAHTNVWAGGQLLSTYSTSGQPNRIELPLYRLAGHAPRAHRLCRQCAADLPKHALRQRRGLRYYAHRAPVHRQRTGRRIRQRLLRGEILCQRMGRFLIPDWSAKVEPVPYAKLDDPQSLNLYSYVRNNPLGGVDADGHQDAVCGGPSNPCPNQAPNPGPATSINSEVQTEQGVPQQQNQSTTATGDPIQNDLQKDVPGVSTVTPQPDPNLDKPHGGHQNETFALTFKTPKEQAAFLKESGRRGLLHKDHGFGPGVRLDGGLHAEHGASIRRIQVQYS